MSKTLKTTLFAVAVLAILFILFIRPTHAGGDTQYNVLDAKNINYISDGTIVYLMDDTDPRDVCEMLDSLNTNIKEVYNVKTLVNADCSVPK